MESPDSIVRAFLLVFLLVLGLDADNHPDRNRDGSLGIFESKLILRYRRMKN
jgi:hypothetical protein